MGPKKGKEPPEELAWRTAIEDDPLDEEIFKVKVVIIEAAANDQDRIYMNKFETYAAEEKRFVVKNICRTETIFMVNQLGGEKKVKDDNLRVFEEGQSYLKEKMDIPPDIQALIIKHLILKMKDEYIFIKRQRLEVKEGIRRESTTMIDRTEVRGTVNVKMPEPAAPPPPEPKGKSKKDEIDTAVPVVEPEEGKKYNTQLRVRGEEWRDKVYVDDFPTDGPNLYVAVTGFVEPLLPSSLIKIGIPLTAIIQVSIDPTTTKVPSTLIRATKRGQSQTEILAEKSYKFWEELQLLRIDTNAADDFKNTAFVVFSPPYWDTESLSGNADKIYDELCFLMYDIQDLTRQHLHYLQNMDIMQIPKSVGEERYQKYYQQQIEDLPLECVTTYSVLDSILQSVCKHQEIEEESSRTSLTTAVTLNTPRKSLGTVEKVEKAEAFVHEVFNTLCNTETDKKVYRFTYGEEYEDHKDPTVINYGDFAKNPTFHLGNINLDNVVSRSLFAMPLHKLWDNQSRPSAEHEAKINFHVNILLSCFQREDVETEELNRLIHILACRKLYNNRSSLKKKHLPPSDIHDFKKKFLKRTTLAEPLAKIGSLLNTFSSTSPSFPSMTRSENLADHSHEEDVEARRIKILFDCPDISELVSAAELANGTPINHLIDDFEHFEDFSGVSAFQILFDAFNKFNCVDYKYCEVTDSFVLMLFNSHDKDGIAREEWRCHLSTPVCLQDFFDFVLEEHYDWIQSEEKMYDEAIKLKSQSEYKVVADPNANKTCVGNTQVEFDLLMEGSLKFQELAAMEEEVGLDDDPNQASSQKLSLSPTSTVVESKSSKKTKTTLGTPRNLRQSFMTTGSSETTVDIPAKPFYGYDLGDRRVEVFGKDSTYFSRDGTRVLTMYTLLIPSNIEYIIMNVVPGNSCNEFWFHRALGEFVSSEIIDYCESFRITSKDQVMMNINKQTYNVPLPLVTSISTAEVSQLFEIRTYHSLLLTWPNGLITESVYEKNSPVISHIKQYHISAVPNLNENMRCISKNGEVLIFRPSGDIEVLRPDGSFIKITKCQNILIDHVESEAIISESSSDKSKKGKGKDKVKDKQNKGSKQGESEDDKEKEVKPPEYELVVEEFEYIETSGRRQQWINDISYTIEKLLIRTATDYCLGEVFSRRMGGTHFLLNKDGVHTVTFPNKTRIITNYIIEDEDIFPEWTDDEKELFDMMDSETMETDTVKSKGSISQKSYVISQASIASSISKKVDIKDFDIEEEVERKERQRTDGYISVQIIYTVEHVNFTTVTINKANGKITIESPNNTAVVIDSDNNYEITLDNMTTANFDGETLHVKYEACPECKSFTTCDIKVKTETMSSVSRFHQNWLKMKDSFSKRIAVNEEGSITVIEAPYSDESLHMEETIIGEEPTDIADERRTDGKSESSVISHGKCREMYLAKTMRFFIMRRELTCAELVHRSLLDQYKRDCRWQPWCSINQYDTFGDHRSLLSMLTPVHLTESEKWLMDSKLADKPKYLTYKDLKKDTGKGFYHWMRPYERFEPNPMKPDNVLPPRLPRAFVLRTLEQQWKESHREMFKGAKELLSAILRYRNIVETDSETLLNVPLVDMRTGDERRIDDVIQALAHRMYEDLKYRLAEDVDSRAMADITTRLPLETEEMSVKGELEEDVVDELKILEEDRRSQIRKVENEEELSPNLRRYWRRRGEEYKEEQFFRYLLREGSVPSYFRNVLGGAIWWEMNDAASQAVNRAERRKMKCVCAEEDETNVEPYM